MSPLHDIRFPNESKNYRAARDQLLEKEIALRALIEEVATLRGQLPMGGAVKEDYEFDEVDPRGGSRPTRLSELFVNHPTLIVYSFMFAPDADLPCPACSSILDCSDAAVRHVAQRADFAVVAKTDTEALRNWAARRGWQRLRLLSSGKNSYNSDYHAETLNGAQIPACNVFVKNDDGIFHFYNTELLYAEVEGHPRHMDLMWPIWNFLDLTPEGRGSDWSPGFDY